MPLRIGFDMDGVFADMASAYREIEARLFGPAAVEDDVPESPVGPAEGGPRDEPRKSGEAGPHRQPHKIGEAGPRDVQHKSGEAGPHDVPHTSGEAGPNDEPHKSGEADAKEAAAARLREQQHRREVVWHAIEATENFWTTLKPLDQHAVRRLADLAQRHRWEVFFLTLRPDTAGDTAQRQTQRWLAKQGFDFPSVIVVRGSRGKVAAALQLDYLVDDTPKNCVDVKAESKATRTVLVLPTTDEPSEMNARWLGIAVARSVGEALDLLEQAQAVRSSPTLWERLAKTVGWT